MIRILSIIICLLAATITNGQYKFSIGPKVGFHTYTTAHKFPVAKDIYDNKYRFGYTIGASMKADLKPTFAIVAELVFSRKGKKTVENVNDWTHIDNFNFIEFPVLLRYQFPESQHQGVNLTPFFNVGPNISYWMKGGSGRIETAEGPGAAYTLGFDTDATSTILGLNELNRFQFGMDIGIGTVIEVKKFQKVSVELRFTWGHTFLGEENSATLGLLGYVMDYETNYRVFSLNTTYFFEIDLRNQRKGASTVKKRKNR